MEALDNRILLVLGVAAFFVLICGMVEYSAAWGWIEGAAIYLAIIAIVTITSANDWAKDKQFVRLQSSVKDEYVPVIRGKYGATQSVNIYDLVVGDIVLLE